MQDGEKWSEVKRQKVKEETEGWEKNEGMREKEGREKERVKAKADKREYAFSFF